MSRTVGRVCSLSLLVALAAGSAACGGDDAGPDAAVADCEAYCDRMQAHCSGDNTQYTSRSQCVASCAALPQGEPGATSGNSLECRSYHAGAALGDPATPCTHGGPGGDGVCGSNCEGFCQLVIATCTGANEVYASFNDCLVDCGGLDDSEPFDVSDTGGDTLACRTYHASVATQDPETHCPHTAVVSSTCTAL